MFLGKIRARCVAHSRNAKTGAETAKGVEGYALSSRDKMFTCKPVEGTCATDEQLARAVDPPHNPGQKAPPPIFDVVRGPDCYMWIMCRSGWSSGDYNRNHCFKALGDACPSGYDHSQVLGEDMYQCKQRQKTDEGDAGAPEGGELDAVLWAQ